MIDGAVKHLRHRYSVVKSVATRRVIKGFADHYGLVYFGAVSQHNDEHKLIRGVTLSVSHRDRHYCVGNIQGRDITLVQRTDNLGHSSSEAHPYTWLIMQFDLSNEYESIDHLFIATNSHTKAFYDAFSLRYRTMQPVNMQHSGFHDQLFNTNYRVLSDHFARTAPSEILTEEVCATIAHHFGLFDFEIEKDKVTVYAANRMASRPLLDNMTRAGLWLSDQVDSIS